jgi:hypothetical protein
MAHTRVVKEHRIVLAGKGSLDGADSGLCNVFVVAGVMEQDGLGDLSGQFQMLVNATTVEADCGIRLTECSGAEGQSPLAVDFRALAQQGDGGGNIGCRLGGVHLLVIAKSLLGASGIVVRSTRGFSRQNTSGASTT